MSYHQTARATEKQLAYIRKLLGPERDIHAFMIDHGHYELKGFREPYKSATVPSKTQASAMIDELKNGRVSVGHAPDIDIVNGY